MRLPFTKRKKQADRGQLTRTEALACIPERSSSVSWESLDNESIRLEYPLTLRPFFLSLAERWGRRQQQRLTRKIELDETGTMVWQMLDGKTEVKAIIKAVANKTGLSLHESEIAVTAFLKTLGKRGLIFLRQQG